MKFTDIVDIKELRAICEDFTTLTGAVTAILDLNGNVLIATGWQDICTQFHRVNPTTAQRCRESDTILAGQLEQGETYNVYKCKNGMVDVAVPIVVDGEHVANFFTGQFFFEPPNVEYFLEQSDRVGFDKDRYIEALKKVPVFSHEQVKSLMQFFSRLVSLIGEMGRARKKYLEINVNLEKERLHLRTLLDTLPEMVWLKDPDGVYLNCNHEFEQLYNVPESEIIGKTDYDFVDRDLADFFREKDRLAADSGVKCVNEEWVTMLSTGRRVLLETAKMAMYASDGSIIGVLGVSRDITERNQAALDLRGALAEAHRFRKALDYVSSYIYIKDCQHRYLYANRAVLDMFDCTAEELAGSEDSRFFPEQTVKQLHDADLHVLAGGQSRQEVNVPSASHGNRVFLEVKAPIFEDADETTVSGILGVSTDITYIKDHQQQLEHIAHYDVLTNLPNRVLLADRLQQGLAQCQRRGLSLAVVYLDLDGFKEINDHHTHDVGDQLLIAVSQRMKAVLREGDTLARIGGDEFVAVLTDLEKPDDCKHLLTRLLQAVAVPVVVNETVLHVSASIGTTLFPQDGADADLLLRHADQAMYQAKQAGKNRYHLFDVDEDIVVKTQRESLERIRQGLERREFVLHYQPKVNLRTGEVIGAEALIRWQHPERGLLPPSMFLPIIEGHLLSIALGDWVIGTVLDQIDQWRKAGLNIIVSANVGARQLQQENFVPRLRELLSAYPQIKPSSLELEILETSAIADIGIVTELMKDCQKMGIRFALDDFGTGYSSLTYLKRLPAEQLKIDQTFIRDMLGDRDDLAIIEGIIGLAQAFRREVIAEGVETMAHAKMLLSLGCHLAQGYGIARPMPAENFPKWVEAWSLDSVWAI
ncbi:MAG TPA: EAL domain-containing protein [Candidatus Sulfotelmatobacter sp.]|jgi:diguanylate cyclase (GGDEF)-like protein/PAS domain S-box-containing protein|nr:EAL domain-containing protein [Candidatus Sulfotelmatobacter sp.]